MNKALYGQGNNVSRLDVFKYNKSGKAIAYHLPQRGIGVIVLDLSPDLQEISGIRTVRQLRHANLSPTEYRLEVEINITERLTNELEVTAKILRVLTSDDTSIARWQSEPNLSRLPVSPHPEVTQEELAWAGKREGTIGEGVGMLLFSVAALAITVVLISGGSPIGIVASLFTGLMGSGALLGLRKHDWSLPRSADPEKLEELHRWKYSLRQKAEKADRAALTAFDARLEEFSGWQTLSPLEFEHAVARALEKMGFSSTTVTQASKDGAVDIEAIDEAGRTTIIQAKKHSKNVGVAVVRELVGVRSTRPDVDRVIVFSLVGFTKGARELAEKTGIELMDARSLTLRV
ncbi:restriction endonuclease [Ruegeria arenilitoris]|uniref:restriction endonuclease n=1 Tax=Ruegeria arenilitoris TaxID=1173585 RepID=UPI00147AD2FF|nr:restriction endonuclease [Ruegeria arenilitoris]